tara:strand:+ start:734 stop:937 length:204 start_codon:yes stop_codon:yes gene_type:complete
MITKKSNIFFGNREVPIVDGEDLKELLPNSHRIAIYWGKDNEKDQYTLRGKKGFGFFAIKRKELSNG